jgi:hypothetical protein
MTALIWIIPISDGMDPDALARVAVAMPNRRRRFRSWAGTQSTKFAHKGSGIAERNRIREEAGLPLLSVIRELRGMKEATDAANFDAFADAHSHGVG